MFIDQYGIKEVTQEIFKKLTALKRTDFLFFISSSFVRRFAKLEEFARYISVNKKEFDESRPEHSHRVVLDYYRSKLDGSEYFLAPFSIKKGSNIYGLIFGSNSSVGMEKFLEAAWAIDKNTGEANFNIDNDSIVDNPQLKIFPEDNVIKKYDVFKRNLLEWLKGGFRSNKEIRIFTIANGMLVKHTNGILREEFSNLSIRSTDEIKKGSFYLGVRSRKKIWVKKNE